MTAGVLRAWARARYAEAGFRPFYVELSSGRRLHVHAADRMVVGPHSTAFGVGTPDAPDELVVVANDQIQSVGDCLAQLADLRESRASDRAVEWVGRPGR